MSPQNLPPYLLRGRSDWRSWLESFPELEGGGYVPAGRFIDDLRRYLGTCPASLLSQPEALDLKQWFEALLRPSDRAVRDNKVKNAVGYIASGVAIAADYLITGGTVSATVAWVSGLFFSTTAALDVANSKLSSRVDEARDIFDGWLNEKRE